MKRSRLLAGFACPVLAALSWPAAAQTITLHGAAQFGADACYARIDAIS